MIQEFQVSNFYSIKDRISLSFMPEGDTTLSEYYTSEVKPGVNLLKMGIIYGSNASGKTTVLEALCFFRELMVNRPSGKMTGINYSPFMLDSYSRNKNSYMQMTFFIDGEKYVLECEFNKKTIVYESLTVYITSRPSLLYERTYSSDTDHSSVTFGAKSGFSRKSMRVIEGNTINNCTVMAALGQSNVEVSRLHTVYNYLSKKILELLSPRMSIMEFVKERLHNDSEEEVKKFLLQILKASDFNIVDLAVKRGEHDLALNAESDAGKGRLGIRSPEEEKTGGSPSGDSVMVFTHSGEDGAFNLQERDESAGTKRFLGMGVILYNLLHNNCFLPIDEVETSIHYELLSYFIKLFLVNSEGTSQLLMTTHDINLLDEDYIRRDVVWFTDKDSRGATNLKRLSNIGLHKTLSVYNAYKQGKLVDLPFLGSIFLNMES